MLLVLFGCFARAEQSTKVPKVTTAAETINPFTTGSYRRILANNAHHPFILAIWSIDCPSCIKDMALLKQIHEHWPDLKIILLAADDLSVVGQIQQVLAKTHLSDLESWVFADENSQKLRFELDPKWYGEMPRTYFFDAAHQRMGVSGVLSKKDYEAGIEKILNKPKN